MTYPTGLAPRPGASHLYLLGERRFTASAVIATVIQPLAVLHDQRRKPSCVGQSWSQVIEAIIGTRVSACDIWEGARALQGNAGVSEVGTRGEFAWWWLEDHGWTDYVPGEDARPEAKDEDHRVGNSLADAMLAHQQRRNRVKLVQTIHTHQRLEDLVAQVVAALQQPNTGLVRETPTTDAYQRAPADAVLGSDYFAGNSGWHAERIAGYSAERGSFLVQGSWGDFTRCTLPDGTTAKGCCWVAPEALQKAGAVDVIRVR